MSEVAQQPSALTGAAGELRARFGPDCQYQETVDGLANLWVSRDQVVDVLRYLKEEIDRPFEMLFDVSAIDERRREHREGQPDSDFTVFYHLISLDRNEDVRIKVPLSDADLNIPTATSVWPVANWYEREAYDMYGMNFEGHPNLRFEFLRRRSGKGIPCARINRRARRKWIRSP